jgi:hypothetical protein
MSSFANLKRNRGSVDALTKAIETISQTTEKSKDDNRFWQPTVDKAGNGTAIIRFLPASAVDGDNALPWVRVFSHGFQGPGGWLIENCLTTLSDKCPVCEHNSVLWNSGIEANKEIVRKQKRKLNYISNILVISDPSNPDNEGEIKLFKYGKKIFDKISEAMHPEFDDEKAVNPFDFWEGANFKMKIRNVEGYRNYDKSEFADPSALLDGDDAQLEALWKKQHSLADFLKPEQFKSYDTIKSKLDKVLGNSASSSVEKHDDEKETGSVIKENLKKIDSKLSSVDDEDVDYFKSLASQDD